MSSEHSDEEMELWARTVDLPGFDDNVSPRNIITMLLRLVVGEVIILNVFSHFFSCYWEEKLFRCLRIFYFWLS